MRSMLVLCLAVLAMTVAVGCAGNGQSPVAPSSEQPALTGSAQVEQAAPNTSQGHALLGYWECAVDPETGMVEFVPLRTSEFHFNMVPILEAGMNITLVNPPTLESGVLHANIALHHPFSGKNNLSGFDVKGILITEGSEAGFGNPDLRIAGPYQTRLLNADGFARWWNPAEFLHEGMTGYSPGKLGTFMDPAKAATLNGYKLYADGFAMEANLSELDPASRAFFQAGSVNSRHFEISLASGLKFNYAVDCSWAAPNPNPPVNLPDDFPPEANQAEPWYIQVDEWNNTLWYQGGDFGGNVNYKITVHDWQGVADLGKLSIQCPGLFNLVANEPDSTTEFTASYHFDITLPELTSADPLDVLITVETPGDYFPALTGVDKPLRGYQRHITSVANFNPVFNKPPVALMVATTPTDILADESVSFDGSDSYDPDGFISQYLWDFNGDGVYGDSYTGPAESPTHVFKDAGDFMAKLKVRDNSTGATISEPVEIHVTLDTNTPPFAVAEATTPTHILEDLTVSFDGSASYDLDGTVVDWKWDFNGDGDYNDAYTGDMQTPTALYADPGTYYADLKVIDNESGWGVLDTKITIIVDDVPNVLPTAAAVATTSTDIDACGSVTFDASGSTDTDGTIESYQWDFDGDGIYGDLYDSGTDVNPTKIFTTDGAWDVDLKVVDNEGGEDTLDTPIAVTVTNIPPIASAEATTPTDILTFESVTFSASASSDPDCQDIASYLWDFNGDDVFGDPYDSGTDENPTIIYDTQGEFNVSLKVTDGNGAEDTTDSPILVSVSNHPPTACAEITTPWPYWWETDIEFSASCSEDLDGSIISYEWDLDADGSYEKTGETASYYFAEAGQHQMQLRVTDNEGASSLLDTPLSFWIWDDTNQPPIINSVNHSRTTSLQNSTAEAVTLGVDFDDVAPPGDTHTYLWTCDYGSFDDATSATPVWTPPNQVVDCDITVVVTDAQGMFDDGTCHQWVTHWTVKSNPNSPNGTDIVPYTMKEAMTDLMIDPSTFKFPEVQPNGNVIYVNFWATWCPYCIQELPDLAQLYALYHGGDYVHIMVDVGESESTVENWINTHPDDKADYWLLDPSNAYFNLTNNWNGDSGGIPQHVIFDRDGNCRGSVLGGIHSVGISILTQYIDELY